MTGYEPADDEVPEYEQSIGERDERSRGGRLTSTVRKRAGNGTLALLAGGVMLARAARAITQSRGRAIVRAAAGAGLVALGMGQRRSAGPEVAEPADTGQPDVTFTDQPDEDAGGPQRGAGDEGVEIGISGSETGEDVEPEEGMADEGMVDPDVDESETGDEETDESGMEDEGMGEPGTENEESDDFESTDDETDDEAL